MSGIYKTKFTIIFLVGIIIIFGTLLLLSFRKFQETGTRLKSEIKTNNNLKDQITELRGYQSGSPSVKPTPSVLDYSNNRSYFLSKIYSKSPNFQTLIQEDAIKRVFQFPISLENDKKTMGGYLVEAENNVNTHSSFSFYLVTSEVQKELVNPMSSYADKNGIGCFLTDYKIVGNESSLNRSLSDKVGYIILSGKCETYGGGRFVSIYKLSTGEKIILKGNIDIGGTMYKGMSETGNALGGVRGVFGVNNLTVVIEFGNDDASAATSLERLSSIGFFNIQTGNLLQVVNFK